MRKDIIPVLFVVLCCIFAAHSERETIVIVYPMASNCSSLNKSSGVDGWNTTLSEAIVNISYGTELHLLPGCHYIETYTLIQNVANIRMIGEGSRSQVIITCAPGLGIAFFNVSKLLIANVTIDGCGLNSSHLLEFQNTIQEITELFFLLEDDDKVAVLCGHCSNLEMRSAAVVNTTGLGFLGINIIGNSSLVDMEFSLNALEHGLRFKSQQVSGGAIFLYHDYLTEYSFLNPCEQLVLSVKQSVFANNYYYGSVTSNELIHQFSGANVYSYGYKLGAGGGLSVIMAQVYYSIGFTADSCVFRANGARYGGGAFFTTFANVNHSHVNILDCSFKDNGAEDNLAGLGIDYGFCGAGIALFLGLVKPINASIPTLPVVEHTSFIFQRTNFTGNRALSSAGLYLLSFLSLAIKKSYGEILLQSCSFEENVGVLDATISISAVQWQSIDKILPIQFTDVSVHNNSLFAYISNSSDLPPVGARSVVSINNAHLIITGNSTFTNNFGTAIECAKSILELENKVTFQENVANFGGALRLVSAQLVIKNHTHVEFHYNSAVTLGGAIYGDLSSIPPQFYDYYDCFLHFDSIDPFCNGNECPDITKLDAHIEFLGNEAPLGGMIYGSTLETCPWAVTLRQNYASNSSNLTLFEILYRSNNFSSPFSFSSVPNTTQTVSTLPHKVQVASGHFNVTPGERFNVSVKVLDHFNRTIPAVLTSSSMQAVVSNSSTQSVLGTNGISFISGDSGTQTQLTVYGEYNQTNVIISLFAVDVQSQLTVNLLNCTSGFIFEIRSCICDPLLVGTVIGCDNSTKNLSVPNGMWVGTVSPHGGLVARECIQDYCKIGAKEVKPPSFDTQCHPGYNRTGLLCGQCIESYSVVFGTNRCHKCTNAGLAWIIFFGFAGIAIIQAICFLQITISEGYLNGVLFYCSIVSSYIPYFGAGIPEINLFVPITFLSLNLGIETCFYDGMDSLSRAWLHLLFPIYLYVLMFLITVLAKYSGRFSRKLAYSGFSPSHLFATLFVMTYTSLLQICAEVLVYIEVKTLSGASSIRWRIDPTQVYFTGSHIPLVILAVLLLVLYVIVAPFLLIFPALSLRISKQLMPIYDAFWAPFKPRFRFWVGLRLLVRAIPFGFASISYPLNILSLGMFVMVFLYIQTILAPFAGAARNAFDIFFMVNLGILTLGSLYFSGMVNASQDQEHYILLVRRQQIFFSVIVTVAYVAFVLIFIWHLVLRFPSIRSKINLKNLRNLRRKHVTLASAETKDYGTVNEDANEGDEEEHENSMNKFPTVVNFSELREPMLEEGELTLSPREA